MGEKRDVQTLIQEIQKQDLRFRSLPQRQKSDIVGYMKSSGLSASAIGHVLDVPRGTVYYYWRQWCREIADFLQKNADVYIGRLAGRAESLYASAKKKGDLNLCWKIECELLDKLMKLGMVDSVPTALDITLRDARDPKIIEDELMADVEHLKTIRDGNGTFRLPAHGSSEGTDPPAAEGGVPEDTGERGDEE